MQIKSMGSYNQLCYRRFMALLHGDKIIKDGAWRKLRNYWSSWEVLKSVFLSCLIHYAKWLHSLDTPDIVTIYTHIHRLSRSTRTNGSNEGL